MKSALIFLAIVAFATAIEVQKIEPFAARSISSLVTKAIEDLRDQMPCGFPNRGIPPLAPLKTKHRRVDINTNPLMLKGTVDNFKMTGLNEFSIDVMKVNIVTKKVTFAFTFSNITVDTDYNMNALANKFGLTVNLLGDGHAKFSILDLVIKGELKYSFGMLSGKLKLKSLRVRTHIGEIDSEIGGLLGEGGVNRRFNNVLAEAIEIGINENEDHLTNTIELLAMPRVNTALEDVVLTDLIGSSGDKETCDPPPSEW